MQKFGTDQAKSVRQASPHVLENVPINRKSGNATPIKKVEKVSTPIKLETN